MIWALAGIMSAPERIGFRGPVADPPQASPRDEQRVVPAQRAGTTAPTTAVWTGDCAMAVELAHVLGPARGVIEPPADLLAHAPADMSWDLGQTATKIRLYEFCLIHGSSFEIYRCVNLGELARMWPQLCLPTGIRAQWAGALREIGSTTADDKKVHASTGGPSWPQIH
jgi:hypothetical protein